MPARHDRLALIWIDAHGDLNTPESSPSGNEWGMPLRMIIDSGAVEPTDVALLGARNLDPPEREFIKEAGVHTGKHAVERALGEVDCVYVAVDFDGLEADEVGAFMPEPGGITVGEAETVLRASRLERDRSRRRLHRSRPRPAATDPATRLSAALGL